MRGRYPSQVLQVLLRLIDAPQLAQESYQGRAPWDVVQFLERALIGLDSAIQLP
jgi:hypothetical protein